MKGSDDFINLLDREREKRNKEIAAWLKDAIPPIPSLDMVAKQDVINFCESELIQAIRRNPTNQAITITFGYFAEHWKFGIPPIKEKNEWVKLVEEWTYKYGTAQFVKNSYERHVAQQLFKQRILDFVESVKQLWEKTHSALSATIESTDQKIVLTISSVQKQS